MPSLQLTPPKSFNVRIIIVGIMNDLRNCHIFMFHGDTIGIFIEREK